MDHRTPQARDLINWPSYYSKPLQVGKRSLAIDVPTKGVYLPERASRGYEK